MRKSISLLAVTAIAMFLANPSAVLGQHNNGWGGGRGGGGGGGGGWGGSSGGRDVSNGSSHPGSTASRSVPAGHPYGHPVHPVGPMAYHHGYYGHWYHGDWHNHYHWDHPWHYGPVAWFSFGFVAGRRRVGHAVALGLLVVLQPLLLPTVVVVGEPPIDYSQPIVLAKTPPGANPTLADQRAAQFLDAAHNAFARGDYAAAMAQTNGAIAAKPNDTVPHEFRALVLFATRRYKEAAGAVYAVLSVGPGWDWATLAGCYPDINLYTAQLAPSNNTATTTPAWPKCISSWPITT